MPITDDEGHMIEAALEVGFKIVDDDAEWFSCSGAQIIDIMKRAMNAGVQRAKFQPMKLEETINRLVTACLVTSFENDAECEVHLRFLERCILNELRAAGVIPASPGSSPATEPEGST